jgi:hypothetical protein
MTTTTEPRKPNSIPASAGMSASFVRDILVSGVFPWVAVLVLQHYGVGLIPALAISTIFPVVDGIVSFARNRRLDALGIVNLVFILGSIAVAFWSGDAHVALLKGAVVTGIFGLVCLGSLAVPKPLMFFLGRQFSTRNDPVLVAAWNDRWQYPSFRRVMRIMTAVWGVAYLVEVAARTIAAYTLPPAVALGTAPIITYGILGTLIAWTVAYGSAMQRKYRPTTLTTT